MHFCELRLFFLKFLKGTRNKLRQPVCAYHPDFKDALFASYLSNTRSQPIPLSQNQQEYAEYILNPLRFIIN